LHTIPIIGSNVKWGVRVEDRHRLEGDLISLLFSFRKENREKKIRDDVLRDNLLH
jgi:hypothetical protein